jgi:hypothetical protein
MGGGLSTGASSTLGGGIVLVWLGGVSDGAYAYPFWRKGARSSKQWGRHASQSIESGQEWWVLGDEVQRFRKHVSLDIVYINKNYIPGIQYSTVSSHCGAN